MENKIWILVALVFAVVLASGCFGYTALQPPAATNNTTITPPPATGTVKEFNITEQAFDIDPPVLNVSLGDNVRVTVTDVDIQHTFTINELGVNEVLTPGATKTFDFVASKKGSFKYYCAIDLHRAQGMEGTINVQ